MNPQIRKRDHACDFRDFHSSEVARRSLSAFSMAGDLLDSCLGLEPEGAIAHSC